MRTASSIFSTITFTLIVFARSFAPKQSSNMVLRLDCFANARKDECKKILAWLFLGAFLFGGCRGYSSPEPPIHPNPNMDTQEKGRPYRESDFFADGRYMRDPIEGTIAVGQLKEDEHFHTGMINGEHAASFPENLVIDEAFIKRGQLVYNRSCAACHSQVGDGDGMVGRRLLVKPTSFHSEYMYGLPPGHYFHVITNGIRTMMPYGDLIVPKDRWAVVSYIRSLQMSQDFLGDWIKRSSSWWMQP